MPLPMSIHAHVSNLSSLFPSPTFLFPPPILILCLPSSTEPSSTRMFSSKPIHTKASLSLHMMLGEIEVLRHKGTA